MTPAEFRAALDRLDLGQRGLALRLGLDVTTVNRWATGKASVPQYAVAYLNLLDDLNESIDEIKRLNRR